MHPAFDVHLPRLGINPDGARQLREAFLCCVEELSVERIGTSPTLDE
jgi:hypothetical protein